MPQVGSLVELTLTVEGADTDTLAACSIYRPNDPGEFYGQVTTYPTDPAARGRWTANLTPDQPGEWRIRWTVTGSGAGVTWDTITVAPDPGAGPPVRTYASRAAAWPDGQYPPDGWRLLARATRAVDAAIRTAVYDVDEYGMPTDPRIGVALAAAVVEQVAWWDEIGDDGSGAVGMLAGAQIGSVRLPGGGQGGGSAGPSGVAPQAWSVLQAAGLTGQGPMLPGAYDVLVRQGGDE